MRGKIQLREIAELAGVSCSAVSRYINGTGYLSQEKREKIRRTIEQLGYEPKPADIASRSRLPLLPSQKRRTLVVALPPAVTDPEYPVFYMQLHSIFSGMAAEKGYQIRAAWPNLGERMLADVLPELLHEDVYGIFMAGMHQTRLSKRDIDCLRRCPVPVIFLARFSEEYPDLNYIRLREEVGAKMVTELLIQRGCKKMAFFSPPPEQSKASMLRLRGFWEAVEEAHLDPADQVTLEADAGYFNRKMIFDSRAAGYNLTKIALERAPDLDGIVTVTDAYATGVLQYLYEIGRRIPDDIRVVTSEGSYSPYLSPPLTAAEIPIEPICRWAIQTIDVMQDPIEFRIPRSTNFCPTLVLRGSH